DGSGGVPSNCMVTSSRSPGSEENDKSCSVTALARPLHNPMAITPTQTLSFLNIASLDPKPVCSCMFLEFIPLPLLSLHPKTGSAGVPPIHPGHSERFQLAQCGFH